MSRRDFLSQPAPENYVAGLGRGATGFTTRSDLGPAREGPSEDQIKAAVAKRSAQLGLTEAKDDDNEDDGRYQDPDNEVGLFAEVERAHGLPPFAQWRERKATRDYTAEMARVGVFGTLGDGLVFLWAMERVCQSAIVQFTCSSVVIGLS